MNDDDDPIVAEVRNTRLALFAAHGSDVAEYGAFLLRSQAEPRAVPLPSGDPEDARSVAPPVALEDPEEDSIIAEVRRIREQLFAAHNYDLNAYCEYLKKRTNAARQAGQPVVSRPPDSVEKAKTA